MAPCSSANVPKSSADSTDVPATESSIPDSCLSASTGRPALSSAPPTAFSEREPDRGSRAVDRDRLRQQGRGFIRPPRIEKRLRDSEPQNAGVTMIARYLFDVPARLVERSLLDQPHGMARLFAAHTVVESEIREHDQREYRDGTGWTEQHVELASAHQVETPDAALRRRPRTTARTEASGSDPSQRRGRPPLRIRDEHRPDPIAVS